MTLHFDNIKVLEHLPVITDIFPLVVRGENLGGTNSYLPFILGFVFIWAKSGDFHVTVKMLVCTDKHMEPHKNCC